MGWVMVVSAFEMKKRYGPWWFGKMFCASLYTDRSDKLYATCVMDYAEAVVGYGVFIMGEYSKEFCRGIGIYQSRNRGLWRKGESSGNTQKLVRIEVDCDRDALAFYVRSNRRRILPPTCSYMLRPLFPWYQAPRADVFRPS